jgi:molybdate transport system substrate-binding protein
VRVRALLLLLLLAGPTWADDEPLRIAVASNFSLVFAQVEEHYVLRTGVPLRVTNGSTGKLYAQIVNGAPFDIFLAADVERPARLEAQGLIVPGSRFTYAHGRLILWSRDHDDCEQALRGDGFVAIANPATAPFGQAAEEYLRNTGLLDEVAGRIAYGENVMQAFHFATTGNAAVGIVSPSLVQMRHLEPGNCVAAVPPHLHSPIEQQVVLLARAADNKRARDLLAFLRSDLVHDIIERNGYGVGQ